MKCEVAGLIRSLLAQLIAIRKVLPEQVKQLYYSYGHGKHQPDFASLKLTLLSALTNSDTCLIIDAADECSDRASLLRLISDVKANCPNVSMLVTSRKEQDIEENLRPQAKHAFCIEDDIVTNDIRLHVQSQLRCDDRLKNWSRELKSEVEDALVSGAKGMYVSFPPGWNASDCP